ncbi:MAG: hypothetical protein CHACPFDD_01820 [Phycisphaerae bacterium]|nr:hypothetical protein [Phycisphaerae bacterium]
MERYSRQVLYPAIGEAGQRRLLESRTVLIGCGALGTVLANTLVRAGLGFLRIVDRDFVELNNLQRQVLFDERDVADGLPKAVAAERRLRAINSDVRVEGVVEDANPTNIERLCSDADLILDGTDNFETRFLINDVAVKSGRPWLYGACVAGEGLAMPIIPGQTPCLRCIWEEAPPPGMSPTCDTAGVLGPVVNLVASFQALYALQILTGQSEALNRELLMIDAWGCRVRGVDMQSARDAADCPCCKHGRFEFLAGGRASATTTLCGRDAVQILPVESGRAIDLEAVARRLGESAGARLNRFMLRFSADGFELTLFPDGRAIVKGTQDAAAARTVYARYVGS